MDTLQHIGVNIYIYNRDTHTSVIVVLACVVPYKIHQGYTYIYILLFNLKLIE